MPQGPEEDVSRSYMDWIYCSVSPGVGWLYYKDTSNPTIGTCVPPIALVSIAFTFTHLVAKCLFFFFFQEGVSLNRILSLIMTTPPSHVILGVRIIGNWSWIGNYWSWPFPNQSLTGLWFKCSTNSSSPRSSKMFCSNVSYRPKFCSRFETWP